MTVRYGEATAMAANRIAKIIQNLAATRLFVMATTAENFIRVCPQQGGDPFCALEECELNAACAAYGVKMLPLWCEIVLSRSRLR